jgi:predicted small metal-binding protein
MKTLTCKQLGGPCDEAISAETKEEMMNKGMAHLASAHPQMAADVQAMPKDDPKMVEWAKSFDAMWENAPTA